MAISVAEYRDEHEPLVRTFNQRMSEGGSHWVFYEKAVPTWVPPGTSVSVRRDFYLAIDDAPAVRGAYCLKRQSFLVNGRKVKVASIQGPISEGLVNQQFGAVALHLIRDMQQREPNLFAWGASEKLLGVLKRMRWTTVQTPLALKVIKGNRFLRMNRFLKGSRKIRLVSDALVATGLGGVAFGLAQFGQRLVAGGLSAPAAKAIEVARFGPWADEIWEAARSHYDLIALRDSDAMNALLPEGEWPEAAILKVELDGEAVGWAVARDAQLKNNPRFGDLRVGSIVDVLAVPGQEQAVLQAAARHLQRRGVDVIVANFASAIWSSSAKGCGFLVSNGRRTLVMSPALAEIVQGDGRVLGDRMHLTLLDGDGPLGL